MTNEQQKKCDEEAKKHLESKPKPTLDDVYYAIALHHGMC